MASLVVFYRLMVRPLKQEPVRNLLTIVAVGLGVYTLVLWALPDLDSRAALLSVGVVLVPFSVAVRKWVCPRYRKERDAAPGEAERQARSVEG